MVSSVIGKWAHRKQTDHTSHVMPIFFIYLSKFFEIVWWAKWLNYNSIFNTQVIQTDNSHVLLLGFDSHRITFIRYVASISRNKRMKYIPIKISSKMKRYRLLFGVRCYLAFGHSFWTCCHIWWHRKYNNYYFTSCFYCRMKAIEPKYRIYMFISLLVTGL